MAISSDNSKIVSASWDDTIKVWELNTGRLLNTLEGHSSAVYSVAISSDNSKIVSGSGRWDKTIKVWDLNTGKLLNTLEGHSSWVSSLAISSDNSKIVSGSADKTIKIWNLNTGKLLNTLEGHSDVSVAISVAISDNSKIVSIAIVIPSGESGSDKTIKFWNLDKGKCYLRYKFDERMISLTLSKNRNFIALGGESGLYLGSLSA